MYKVKTITIEFEESTNISTIIDELSIIKEKEGDLYIANHPSLRFCLSDVKDIQRVVEFGYTKEQ